MSWNRPSNEQVKVKGEGGQRNVHLGGLVTGVIAALGAAVAAWLLWPNSITNHQSPDANRQSRIREVHPAVTAKSFSVSTAKPAEPKDEWHDDYINDPKKRLAFSKLITVRTNETSGMIIERFQLPNGKTWRRVSDPPPIFDNPCDQAIAMVLGDASGAMIMPVPGLDTVDLDAEFQKAILSPIRILENDSPEVASLKLVVKETRAQIIDMIKAGDNRSIGEMLQEHIDINNRNAELRTEAVKQIELVRQKEGEDFAKDYLGRVNESLKAYGVPPLEGYFDKDETGADDVTNE